MNTMSLENILNNNSNNSNYIKKRQFPQAHNYPTNHLHSSQWGCNKSSLFHISVTTRTKKNLILFFFSSRSIYHLDCYTYRMKYYTFLLAKSVYIVFPTIVFISESVITYREASLHIFNQIWTRITQVIKICLLQHINNGFI